MTKRWSDVKRQIRSISKEEKLELELIAHLVGRLTKRRLELEMTQKELAERTGIKQPAIARLESGQNIPRLDTLLKIAEALGMNLNLVDNEEAAASLSMQTQI